MPLLQAAKQQQPPGSSKLLPTHPVRGEVQVLVLPHHFPHLRWWHWGAACGKSWGQVTPTVIANRAPCPSDQQGAGKCKPRFLRLSSPRATKQALES